MIIKTDGNIKMGDISYDLSVPHDLTLFSISEREPNVHTNIDLFLLLSIVNKDKKIEIDDLLRGLFYVVSFLGEDKIEDVIKYARMFSQKKEQEKEESSHYDNLLNIDLSLDLDYVVFRKKNNYLLQLHNSLVNSKPTFRKILGEELYSYLKKKLDHTYKDELKNRKEKEIEEEKEKEKEKPQIEIKNKEKKNKKIKIDFDKIVYHLFSKNENLENSYISKEKNYNNTHVCSSSEENKNSIKIKGLGLK